jgi:signal transduction histidine kinase
MLLSQESLLNRNTFFAPAGRANELLLAEQQQAIIQAPFITQVLNALPDMMLVLNEHRQIVAVNNNLMTAFGVQDQILLTGLLAAESGEYVPDLKQTNLKELVEDVCKLYGNHVRTPDRKVMLENVSECLLITDAAMLRRVIGNMVINALEATPAGGIVKISLFICNSEVFITVTNLGEIPKDVQIRIFKRSFSTKNTSGRGIVSYSMKLFGERYLGGSVGFSSQNGETTFFIKLQNTG